MAVARGEAGFWPLKAILVLGRPGTGWNQKTIQKKSSRSNSANATVTLRSGNTDSLHLGVERS